MKNILILGSGAMGSQIAFYIADKGYSVTLFDIDIKNLDKSETNLKQLIEKQKFNTSIIDNILFLNDLDSKELKNIDLVIEAVIEQKEVKQKIFNQIESRVSDECIITSNSSSIVSSDLIEGLSRTGNVCNLHFFNPVHRMKLVEIVKGQHTSNETINKLKHFIEEIEKEYVVVEKEIIGFVVNRILASVIDEALYLYDEGFADFKDIDKAVKLGLNHPMGPFELLDYTGIDVNYYIKNLLYDKESEEKRKPTKSLIDLYEKGDLGIKTGRGYYEY